jgi:hypothetical protein
MSQENQWPFWCYYCHIVCEWEACLFVFYLSLLRRLHAVKSRSYDWRICLDRSHAARTMCITVSIILMYLLFPKGVLHNDEEVFCREQDGDPRHCLDRKLRLPEVATVPPSILLSDAATTWLRETSEHQRARVPGNQLESRGSTAHSCSRAICIPFSIFCLIF